MKWRVVWSRRAANDVDAIADYIARDSRRAASRVVEHIRTAAAQLSFTPRMGRQTRNDGAREWILSRYPYVIIYELHDNEVRILAVFHQSQDR